MKIIEIKLITSTVHCFLFIVKKEANLQTSHEEEEVVVVDHGQLQHQRCCVYLPALESPVYMFLEEPHGIA